MATQFMPPSSYMTVPPVMGYNGYPNGKTGGFSFRKRVERVDWRKISMVDIENISRTLDFTTLQENIMNITFCNLEAELDIRTVDPNFVKLFKLAQLTIEYLLHSQEFLATLCTSLEEKAKQSDQEVEKLKQDVEAVQKELAEVKKESHKRKKMLIAQQQLLHVGNESYNKCPFCAKAFINNSYLQSHIIRRHSAISGNKDISSPISPDLGVGSESGRNNIEAEILHLKERLLKYEAEHHEDKQTVTSNSIRKSTKLQVTQVNQNSSVPMDNLEEGEKIGMSAALMKELRELNAKYQASQKALQELEARTGGKRSYLGDLEDEVENEKELLKEQRSEVAAFKEQLQQQLDLMKNHMETKLTKQERKWQKRMQHMTQEHASEIKKLNNALETTSRSQEEYQNPKLSKQQQEVQEILRLSREREKELEIQEKLIEKEIIRASKTKKTSKAARVESTQVTALHGAPGLSSTPGVKQGQMYPSDDEGSPGFGTGTSSLRTFHSDTGRSTLGQTGTQSLHTMQFLEELRKNPTLAVMREQLAEMLQEQVEKKGIPPGQTGITDEVLKSKLAILSTQRQMHVQKYPDFNERREHFNKTSTEEARKQLKVQSTSTLSQPPHGEARRRLELSQTLRHDPGLPTGFRAGPPHPQQHLSSQRATPQSPGRHGISPHAKPQPQPRTPQHARLHQSTGSTPEWASSKFDSDEDSLEEEGHDFAAGGKISGPPGTRLIQSGPARGPTPSPRSQGPKARLIQSKPLNTNTNNDIDNLNLDRDNRKPFSASLPSGKTGSFSDKIDMIEKQMENRNTKDRPFGGVNVGVVTGAIKQKGKEGNSDLDNDWDDVTESDEPAPAVAK
ncbi:unnamed protein product [Candidula unifasciata]|uniref:C2H2-type domain-containing protein n=1 Tax=Candidula unifasciata TaxID=100452 RepID=A0A8S3ZCM8_9EUPU|nr:unnamed protein product [Candidula unifasciata]